MSNRIDFFQPQQNQLAIPASNVSVLLDGQLCSFLAVTQISMGANPDFSYAKLICNPDNYEQLSMGATVNICQVFDNGTGISQPQEFPLFNGYIETINSEFSNDKQTIEVIAKDASAKLKRITVYGRHVPNDGDILFLCGMETIFNPDGQANASTEAVNHNGGNYTVFAANETSAKYFSCADAIYYLLNEYAPQDILQIPSLVQLQAQTNNLSICDVDVTGSNLIEALQRCCDKASLRFKFICRHNQTGPKEAIVFFQPGTGSVAELNCQFNGEQLNISKTNVTSLRNSKDSPPVTNRFILQGDFKKYEATFELIQAWDPALEDTEYEKFSPVTNENFNQIRNVYRKWCLNETGAYTGSPYNQGQAFDFSAVFENASYVNRPRRFLPTLTTDADGSCLGYFLEVSYTAGAQWWPYHRPFDVLLDECGIWLSSEQLDVDVWFAILKGNLKFRITASVIADNRLSVTFADGPLNSTTEVTDRIITLPRQFKYRKISPESIFYNCDDEHFGAANEADDTETIVEYARTLAENSIQTIETFQIGTSVLTTGFNVGNSITSSPDSRDILGIKYDPQSICRIERVKMDFIKQQTYLEVVKTRR